MTNSPLYFVAAADSFKGVCTSREAGDAICSGIEAALRFNGKRGSVCVLPVADGGEGTADALTEALGGSVCTVQVSDPFGYPINAAYGDLGIQDSVRTAVLDMAAAAGFSLAKAHGPDPLRASTYGVGEMIRYLVQEGYGRILVGLGGSGTNDGGIGALEALGAVFTDADHNRISGKDGGQVLEKIAYADLSAVFLLLSGVEMRLLYDVSVPLTGNCGATCMFSRQKGADDAVMERLEAGMLRYSSVITETYPALSSDVGGAGAAGGLGFGLYAAGGILSGGAAYVLDCLHLRDKLADAVAVFTGEGKTDRQSAFGKLPSMVAGLAREEGVPCICLCGAAEPEMALYEQGMSAVFAIADRPLTLEESLGWTKELLRKTAFNCANLLIQK